MRRRLWTLVAAALAVLGVGAAALLLLARPDRGLEVTVEGGDAADGGDVAPGRSSAVTMRFTDGSEVALSAGGRGRLAGMSERGARIVLEGGEARVKVAPRPDAEWVVEAGPFSVRVTGTLVEVGWSPAEEAIEVRVIEGSVVVRGPLSLEGVALRAGQRLTARARDRSFEVREASSL